MRKTPLIVVLVAFALWFVWKGLPFLDGAQPEIYSTPTVQPQNAAELGNVGVPRGQQVCADQLDFGPGARYVLVTVLSDKPAGPLRFAVRAPGYAADATAPAGATSGQQVIVPIRAASKDVANGTLCITNLGKRKVGFYSVGAPGPQATPSTTTVAGKPVALDLSITLLTSPSRSFGSRLGTILGHTAAFNPLKGWVVWILLLLVLIGAPLAVGAALARADAEDDAGGGPVDGR
jgi:hypothetical protein